MTYLISYQPRALDEYEKAVTWYKTRSQKAAENFVAAIEKRVDDLKKDPEQFRKTYKEFREVSLLKYPYSLIYFVNGKEKQVIISSIFHHKRNPERKPK